MLQEHDTATFRGLLSPDSVSRYELILYLDRHIRPPLKCPFEFGLRLFFGDKPSQCQRKSLTLDSSLGDVGVFENLAGDGVSDRYERTEYWFDVS